MHKPAQEHKPCYCTHIRLSPHHVSCFLLVWAQHHRVHASILPVTGRDASVYTDIYIHICTNVLLYVSVFILSSTLLLSLSKGRNKYLSEIICCRQAYCLQGIRVPFWGASILHYWLISCILFGAEGLKALKKNAREFVPEYLAAEISSSL